MCFFPVPMAPLVIIKMTSRVCDLRVSRTDLNAEC